MLLRGGVPYSDPRSTLSLLPGAVLGRFLGRHAAVVQGRLLDVGCGNRPYAPWYDRFAERSVGLDATPGRGVDVLGFADRLPFADETFDTVVATEVLEHVTDARRAVAELHRVLRPGGHALVTVPFLYPTHEAPYDFRRFTHFGLRSLLEGHGLEVVTLEAKGGPLVLLAHFLVLAVVATLRRCGRAVGLGDDLHLRWPVRPVVAGPQQAVLRFLRAGSVDGLGGTVSLGYLACVRRPPTVAPPAWAELPAAPSPGHA